MSTIPLGVTVAAAAAAGLLQLPFAWFRSIGLLIPNVVVRETHNDELAITEHPVEQGAAIADHAYKRPCTIIVEAGWSNSAIQALGNPDYVRQMYGELLALQASRTPFDVLTGKRAYRNMLMVGLSTITDERTENVLLVRIECREVILVTTQTVTVPASAVQKDPGSTAATVEQGTKQAVPTDSYKVQ